MFYSHDIRQAKKSIIGIFFFDFLALNGFGKYFHFILHINIEYLPSELQILI